MADPAELPKWLTIVIASSGQRMVCQMAGKLWCQCMTHQMADIAEFLTSSKCLETNMKGVGSYYKSNTVSLSL